MEIVLTKSAEFDAIVAEENEPHAADSGEYGGESLCQAWHTPCLHNQWNFPQACAITADLPGMLGEGLLLGGILSRTHHMIVP